MGGFLYLAVFGGGLLGLRTTRAAEDIVYKEEPVKRQPPPPASAQVVPFDPNSLVPFFQTGPLGQAAERLRIGDAAGAVRILSEAMQAPGGAALVQADMRARFLLAVAQLRAAQSAGPERLALAARAAEHFDALVTAYPLLKNYHLLYGARAQLLAQHFDAAIERAHKVPGDSVLDCEARLLRADALQLKSVAQPVLPPNSERGQGQSLREQAANAYAVFISVCPASHRREAEVKLAELFDQLDRTTEALSIWRRLYLEAPHESYGALAAKRLDLIRPGTRTAPFSATELLSRAQVLFDQMRNAESEAAFRLVLEQPDLDEAQRCIARYHLAQSVFKQRDRKRAAPLFDEATAACAPGAAKNDDLHMKALYQAARSHANAGMLQHAADLFAEAEAAHPGHSYADDARLRQAEMYQDLADHLLRDGPKKTCQADTCPDYEPKIAALLADLPDRYPSGDKRGEALWRLSLRALRKGDMTTARSWLETAQQKIPREVGWDQEGRTLYWLGRVAEMSGDSAGAARSYRRAVEEYPLSFYTLLALSRLRASNLPELSRLLKDLQGDGSAPTEFTFAPRALFSHEAFLRGVELLRLGLGSEARREFQSIGIAAPDERPAAGTPLPKEREELLWLASVLFDRAGAWNLSHAIPRYVVLDWQRHYPVGTWRNAWRLAYPRGFRELLATSARENGQPEALQLAIVREESAFDPRTESFANAVGLTQMIEPTAKRFSNGLPYDRESLRDPGINVAIGGRFLGFLWQLWTQNPALTVPSYNAGEARVVQWLKAAPPGTEIDLFIESIPYDETRGYTKRVLSSYLTYYWLYAEPPAGAPLDARLPAFLFTLPPPPRLRG